MDYDKFSDDELARAIELMVTPAELMSRHVMTAILAAAEYTPQEVEEQFESGEPLNDGPCLSWNF